MPHTEHLSDFEHQKKLLGNKNCEKRNKTLGIHMLNHRVRNRPEHCTIQRIKCGAKSKISLQDQRFSASSTPDSKSFRIETQKSADGWKAQYTAGRDGNGQPFIQFCYRCFGRSTTEPWIELPVTLRSSMTGSCRQRINKRNLRSDITTRRKMLVI